MEIIKCKYVGNTVRFGQYIGVVVEMKGSDALVEFKKLGSVQWIATCDLTPIGR